MQLFAFDSTGPVLASQAQKQKDYLCPECKGPVRLRSGPERQPHYYHIELSPQCKQHQKSEQHLQAQLKLLALLPEGECSLERPFPSISRIADVVWEKAQIVFEIQCSPISQQEVQERTADYRAMGMKIVWILHDKRFNQKKLSAAESHLRKQPCYYTNITRSGQGIFYDQFEIIQGPLRKFKGPPLPIFLDCPMPIRPLPSSAPSVTERQRSWDLCFKADLLHRLSQENKSSLQHLNWIEKKYAQAIPFKPLLAFFRLYELLFNGLIRSCSKP